MSTSEEQPGQPAPSSQPNPADAHASPLGSEGQLLRVVLQHLPVPAHLKPLAQDIERALAQPLDEAARQKLTAQLIHLLEEAKAYERQRQAELQAFLKTTVGRLVQLEATLSEANHLSQQAGAQAAQTRQLTDAQFLQLRNLSAESDDLERLKSFIGERLDRLQDYLHRQEQADDQQQRLLQEQLALLSQQIAQLGAETLSLRSRLDVTTEEALRDPLTGAYNRLAFDRRAALEFARWRSDGGSLSMIVCDIDNFKRINDTFGHSAGDKVLKEVAHLLQQQLRSSDFIARYGGEEFVVILNGAAEDAALRVAEKLRRTIKAAPFHSRGTRVPVTISCGVASFHDDDTLETVFERADAALYTAKAQGRDRCVLASHDDGQGKPHHDKPD